MQQQWKSKVNKASKHTLKLAIGLWLLMVAWLAVAVPAKDPEHAWQLIESGAVLIDVRTPEEFRLGHLTNAINIPYEQILQGVRMYQIKPDTSVVVYCRSGRRSGIAQQQLAQAGFSNAYNGGGFEMLKMAQHTQIN